MEGYYGRALDDVKYLNKFFGPGTCDKRPYPEWPALSPERWPLMHSSPGDPGSWNLVMGWMLRWRGVEGWSPR